MSDLQIIYTPNAHDFIPHVHPELTDRTPGNPVLQNLRINYECLREKCELGETVGVITIDDIWRENARRYRKQIEEISSIKKQTYYLPLDILEACAALNRENESLNNELNYRVLNLMLSRPVLTLDQSLPIQHQQLLYLGCVIPAIVNSKEITDALSESQLPLFEDCIRIGNAIYENFPNWEDIDLMKDYLQARFEANKVGRDFPLNFLPPGRAVIDTYSVDLQDEVMQNPLREKTVEWVQIGCRSAGYEEVPAKIMGKINHQGIDLFACTQKHHKFTEMLEKLTEPKSIITDLYPVDHFSKLRNFELITLQFMFDT